MRLLPSEASHTFALKSLQVIDALNIKLIQEKKHSSINHLKIFFRNRLGLAGGLDKNGDYIDCLSNLGFSFLELGTVTPFAQSGNPKPRLYRDKTHKALINNMGFNNKGIDYLINNIRRCQRKAHIAISIGKNYATPLNKAIDDYIICYEKAYPVADFLTINISSPNTKNLRQLGSKNYLPELIQSLKAIQKVMSKKYGHKSLVVKLSPDIDDKDLESLIKIILREGVDGLITTNTSSTHSHLHKPSGISGKPLFELSTSILKKVRSLVDSDFPLIASGGVMDTESYNAKLRAGADLVQIYTGLIYKGPSLIQEIFNSSEVN